MDRIFNPINYWLQFGFFKRKTREDFERELEAEEEKLVQELHTNQLKYQESNNSSQPSELLTTDVQQFDQQNSERSYSFIWGGNSAYWKWFYSDSYFFSSCIIIIIVINLVVEIRNLERKSIWYKLIIHYFFFHPPFAYPPANKQCI